MNQKNNELDESRYLDKYEEKIKRIKNGVIFVIIFAGVIIASNAIIEMQYIGSEVAIIRAFINFEDGYIDRVTYESIRRTLEFDQLYFRRIFSVVRNFGKVVINIGFLTIILGFLSITVDKSFNRKMRRISLILSAILFLGILYLIFEYLAKDVLITGYYPVY